MSREEENDSASGEWLLVGQLLSHYVIGSNRGWISRWFLRGTATLFISSSHSIQVNMISQILHLLLLKTRISLTIAPMNLIFFACKQISVRSSA